MRKLWVHAGGTDLIDIFAEFHVPRCATDDRYSTTLEGTAEQHERNCDTAPEDGAVTVHRGHAGECEECKGVLFFSVEGKSMSS